ncbi:cysteine proteinase [Cylindrobasidium torrendii FP15055 ss-10]|uniref:Ubiquitin carboxyl-terminal hydrolase n=1 Tax=Cylindrobasidium torrendii FP15055 ss-10 TaxID=1314674 RepID=A0A0D7BUS7_9AGAR|nr:cysteine proteinase [Cylindrobasidium torrendii FP15055 ss-10]
MARAKWIFGAPQASAEDPKALPIIPPPSTADAKRFGLENFGNTCYANSVIQALYFCTPFRDLLIQSEDDSRTESTSNVHQSRASTPPPVGPPRAKPASAGNGQPDTIAPPSGASAVPIPESPPTLFAALRSLYLHISSTPADKGTVAPRALIDKVREGNEIFRSPMHQDAHEFLNYMLNKIVEEESQRTHPDANGDLSNSISTLSSSAPPTVTTSSSGGHSHAHESSIVHKLFEGVLTSETRCLTCERVSARDETFLDLSIDIEQNSSVTACLRQFSASEMLCHKNKFFCDSCCDLQEAEKRMKIKKLPNVLALHLKRFKYQDELKKYIKLAYRVAFPFELRLFNTVDDTDDADRLFNLFAIVVHIGNGPHHGHYISIIKSGAVWLVFDDETVSPIPESEIPKYFGDSNSGSAYVLYYQAADIDRAGLGIRTPSPVPEPVETPAVVLEQSSSPIPSHTQAPPGLEEENSSDLSDPPFPITPSQSSSPRLQPSDKSLIRQPLEIQVHGVDAIAGPSSATGSTPITTAPRKGGLFKRRPSTSASTNGADARKSLAEKSGLPPLPLPAMDPSQPSAPLTSGPTPLEREVSQPKEARHKDPERKSSTWFKKRTPRSRPGSAYGMPETLAPSPMSPMSKTSSAEDDHAAWTQNTDRRPSEPTVGSNSKLAPPPKVRPKSSGGGLAAASTPDKGRRTDYESTSVASTTSSIASTSQAPLHLSTSLPYEHPAHVSPTRSSLDRIPHSPEHKKSFTNLTFGKKSKERIPPRPSTSTGVRPGLMSPREPPVPAIPKEYLTPTSPNGHANEPDGHHLRPSDVPALDSTASTSSSSNASSNWKRTSRKLSLSMGFGFGKKDKEKEKKDKDKPPTSYNGFIY